MPRYPDFHVIATAALKSEDGKRLRFEIVDNGHGNLKVRNKDGSFLYGTGAVYNQYDESYSKLITRDDALLSLKRYFLYGSWRNARKPRAL
jgi:hypothetical protein